MEGNKEEGGGAITEFYSGKNVFITGATGFVGMALVEKLLRTVPKIGNIYLLIREKKGKTPKQRMQEYIDNQIFSVLRDAGKTDVFEKLVAIQGDVGEERLGISDDDRATLTEKINVIIHSAATLDFEADLRSTVDINLLGTMKVLDLASHMNKLLSFVHISSAYVNSHLSRPEEILYPVHKSASQVIATVKGLADEDVERETPIILGKYLNTYTFTKALAEQEVDNHNSQFPTTIVRPSMIVAAWKEPIEGWTISKNGPQGFIMGAAKGVVRRLPLDPNIIADYIPVDIVVNAIIAAGWNAATKRPEKTTIFHVTSSSYKPFRWCNLTDVVSSTLHRWPLKSAVWYPNLKFIPSIFWYKLTSILFHLLPAYILDFITKVAGGRPILVRMHTNISRSLSRLEPFIFTEWIFSNTKTMELHRMMDPPDQKIYNLDIQDMDWEKYFDVLTQGVRRFLHNERPQSLVQARKKDKILGVLNLLLQGGFLLTVWFIIAFITRSTMSDTFYLFPMIVIFYSFL